VLTPACTFRVFLIAPAVEAWELDALRSAGIGQAVVVDLTREEFGIPVVRAVVPGLEGSIEMVSSCRLGQRAIDLAGSR
jgi:ribosomal protein S12 methylthiotransferase accessory factor YcaO